MMDTPIHINGPFTLSEEAGAHVIRGRDGIPICDLTGQLIDGSGRHDEYPDGIIRSRQARREEAKFVVDAMNHFYLSLKA